MSILDTFDSEIFQGLTTGRFEDVQQDESEELLDYLGYIDIYQNSDQRPSPAEVAEGIVEFRSDLSATIIEPKPATVESPFLSPEEVAFLGRISSLENEFALHQFSLSEISGDRILSRILAYRLSALSIVPEKAGPVVTESAESALAKLKGWLSVRSLSRVIELAGDVVSLIRRINEMDEFEGSSYFGVVFFQRSDWSEVGKYRNVRKLLSESFELLPQKANRSVVPLIDKATRYILRKIPNSPVRRRTQRGLRGGEFDEVRAFEEDEVNRLVIRLVQLRLWLQGTYVGKLDNDMGSLSHQAIEHFAQMVNYNQTSPVVDEKSFLIKLSRNHWAINAKFFFGSVFQSVDAVYGRRTSISREIDSIAEGIRAPDRNGFYVGLSDLIDEELVEEAKQRKHKRKTRNGRGFWGGLRAFFGKIAQVIKQGISAVLSAIHDFFRWVKNGAKSLIAEIKEAYETFRTAIRFIFGKRIITTAGLTTDFDFDFDAVSRIENTLNQEDIGSHVKKIDATAGAFLETSVFLSRAIPLVVELLTPPLGWLKAGLRLARLLLRGKLGTGVPSFVRLVV